jgi:hypothetical protein
LVSVGPRLPLARGEGGRGVVHRWPSPDALFANNIVVEVETEERLGRIGNVSAAVSAHPFNLNNFYSAATLRAKEQFL